MASRPEQAVSADVLAEETKVPCRYLTLVMQDFFAGGLVNSRPGPGAGFEFGVDTAKLTILDVVNVV